MKILRPLLSGSVLGNFKVSVFVPILLGGCKCFLLRRFLVFDCAIPGFFILRLVGLRLTGLERYLLQLGIYLVVSLFNYRQVFFAGFCLQFSEPVSFLPELDLIL
ncbi:MAG: hypothetical protein BWY75_03320 [bacterium ADurb.Bin425]|nr:MAG: hypothetical protein BWY75_03320 [bacterium ADurb.Bin425]